jgi:hypothetical protein
MRLLHRGGREGKVTYGVVLPAKGERGGGEDAFEDLNRLCQPTDTKTRRIERDAALLIVRAVKASAQAEHQTPLGEEVDRGEFAAQQKWVTKIVGQDVTANA